MPIPSTAAARRNTSLPSPAERQSDTLLDVRQLEGYSRYRAEASLKLLLTNSTAVIGMHSRIGSVRVRHLDVRWLWEQVTVQAVRFTRKR